MQELIILFEEYKPIILVTVLTVLQIFFVIKRSRLKKQIRNQVLLIKKLLSTNDSKHPIFENMNYIHHELQTHTGVSIHMKQSWESFYQVFQRNHMAGNSMVPSIEDHFDEYEFTQELGNRKIFEWLPGIFLIIGILPTFLGLTLSTYYLDVKNAHFMDQVIYVMSGVGIAFFISIIAIGFSLFWQISDQRTYYPFLLKQYDELLDALQQAFPSDEDLKTFLSQTFIQSFVQQITSTLTPHLEANQSIMKETLNRTTEDQVSNTEKIINQVVESLGNMIGDQMQELGHVLRQTVQWQEKVHSEMTKLVQSLQKSAIKQIEMVEKTTVLTTEIQQHASHLSEYQTVCHSSISEMNDTTNKNRELQISITNLLEKITAQTAQFSETSIQLEEVLSSVNEISHTNIKFFDEIQEMQHNLHAERQQIQQHVSEQLQQMDHRSSQLKEHWSDTHLMIKEVNKQLNESTDRFVQHMHSGLEQTFTQFDTALTDSVRALASGVSTLKILFQELPTQVEQLNHHVGEINSTLSKSITDANQSITQAIREVQHQTEVLSRISWS